MKNYKILNDFTVDEVAYTAGSVVELPEEIVAKIDAANIEEVVEAAAGSTTAGEGQAAA